MSKITRILIYVAIALALGPDCAISISAAAAKPSDHNHSSTTLYNDPFVLGPGDKIRVELQDIPELSGNFSIGPDVAIYIPRLRALHAQVLTVEEIPNFLTDQFKLYVKSPQVYVTPIGYHSVRVCIGGEITRPGYYMLSGGQVIDDQLKIDDVSSPNNTRAQNINGIQSFFRPSRSTPEDISSLQGLSTAPSRWPTLFDALRAAQGVTPYSDFSAVKVFRKQPMSQLGGKVQAQVNFLSLVMQGDESVNIRLFDGDVVKVGRSEELLRDQLLAASRTNLSPDFIEVFVSGRVKEPGPQSLPQGSTLNQEIASAGGTKLLRGGIEFLHFNPRWQDRSSAIQLQPVCKDR